MPAKLSSDEDAGVAQLAEQGSRKAQGAGSTPAAGPNAGGTTDEMQMSRPCVGGS